MLDFFTFSNIVQYLRVILDITIMSFLLYYTIKIVRNNSRTVQIFKGILFVVFIDVFASALGLTTVAWVAHYFVNYGILAIIIIFQPEIRSLLEKLGKSTVFSRISTLSGDEKANLANTLTNAADELAASRTGALITIEQGQSLSDYIKTGTPMNSMVSRELLNSIFVPGTPLHDGAVIIQGDRIACASAYFPPTSLDMPSRYGARHRAALGISEITDSITIVVSEETGTISIAQEGKLMPMTVEKLREFLMKVICNTEVEVNRPKQQSSEVPQRIMQIEQEILASKKKQNPAEEEKVEEAPVSGTMVNLSRRKNNEDSGSLDAKAISEQWRKLPRPNHDESDTLDEPLFGDRSK
ncbi:MAG: diadenylate cyclase CdaA [Erysipelotrichaceae bacterium]|jgi:diadenylate cyclase|nr:diadenylate cyclase CdaA [Erysipelotrichaceae bacterium]